MTRRLCRENVLTHVILWVGDVRSDAVQGHWVAALSETIAVWRHGIVVLLVHAEIVAEL